VINERWQVIHGDCLAHLDAIPRDAVIVSDPPYGMAWNTNSKRFTGGASALRRGEGRDDWGDVGGDAEPFDPTPWLDFPRVVLWGSHHFAQRLPVGTTLVWIKRNDPMFGTFLSDAEIGWQKGGHGVYCHRRVFHPPTRALEGGGQVAHPTQKPLSLMRWCISRLKLAPGTLVVDPYCGSGTTGVAAMMEGMQFLGIEREARYVETARRRIAAAADQGTLDLEAA
jgi:DNA modification methylase